MPLESKKNCVPKMVVCTVKVSEEGSEAAAATAFALMTRSAPPKPFDFKATRPFVYILVERTTGAVIFSGRIVDPTKKNRH